MTCNELYLKENIVEEEMDVLNDEITSDEAANEVDSHMRSPNMEVASVNRFIDELHVSVFKCFIHTVFQMKYLNSEVESHFSNHFKRIANIICKEGICRNNINRCNTLIHFICYHH